MCNNENCSMNEQEKMTDLLSMQKYLSGVYNSACCESATPFVKQCLCNMLTEVHGMQGEIFNEMTSRGWYSVEKAEETKINSVKQKYGKQVTV